MRIVTTLRQALTLYYLAAATLPLLLFSFFTLHYANNYLLQEVLNTNADLSRELRSQTETFLQQRRLILEHAARIIFREKLVRGDDINRYLSEELGETGFFDALLAVDSSGKVNHVAAAGVGDDRVHAVMGSDLSGHELFRRFAKGELPGWSGGHVSVLNSQLSVCYGVAIDDHLLIGNINQKHLTEIISHFDLDGGLRDELERADSPLNYALVDQEGVVIAHSDPEVARRNESLRGHTSIAGALAQGEVNRIEDHIGQSLVETATLVPETGWVVWVGRDLDSAMSPLFKMRNLFLAVFSGAVLLAVVAVIITSRWLMRPLRYLLVDVRNLAAGEFEDSDSRTSFREIDELSTSFRQLGSQVREREAALVSGERRFRSLVNSVEGMVVEATLPELQITFVNERTEDLTGYSPKEWLENPDFWVGRLHPDDRQWAVEYRHEQSQRGHAFQYEYRLKHRDGHVVWLREMASVVAEEGMPPRLLSVAIDITASKEAELSLQESEQRFRSLVEQAADAIFIHDLNGILLDVNEQACRSLGYRRNELQGMSISDIEKIQYPLQFSSLWNSVQRGGSLTFEAEHRRKDDSIFPVEVRLGSFLHQEQPMLLALVRDITDRKRALQALRESEERYRSVVSAMTEGVLLTDPDGLIVAANPAVERIFDLPHTQLLSLSVDEAVPELVDEHGEVRTTAQMPEQITRQTGKPVRNALLARSVGGKPAVWLEINTQPIFHFGETGVAGVVTTFTDITDRKEATEALRQSEEQVRLLLNSTAEGIFGLDLEGKCSFCNPAALRLLMYSCERDLLGRDIRHLLRSAAAADDSTESADPCLVRQPLEKNVSVHCDTEQFWRSDGSSFDAEYWAHPILKDGVSVGAVVTFHDITERKRMQQQTIRNAQLASLGELAAGVAHEINNPVSGVINYAQILLNRAEKQGHDTDLVERIIREGERIATIVRDMLSFAREGGGEMHISRLSDLLQDAISLSAAQLRKEGLVLNIDIADDLPLLKVRAQQIQQLFLNLLSNARHALREKPDATDQEKQISISATGVAANGNGSMVRVVVEDRGIGIPATILPRVMNPFVTTKPAGVGTGLGLSISHEIVKQHGGEIRIESKEGEMTRVIVDLPAIKGDVL